MKELQQPTMLILARYMPCNEIHVFQRIFLLLEIGVQEFGLKISKSPLLCGPVLILKT
jgi:hypothetical protein